MGKTRKKCNWQTIAANDMRWGIESPADRWAKKRDKILLFIGRIGWGTVELTNYFLGQSNREWVKKLQKEKLIYLEKTIIGDKTVSGNKSNCRVATIILISENGQKHVRALDKKIGNRIPQINQHQSRHDLIAMWSAVHIIRDRSDLQVYADNLQIWSDQVMRKFDKDEITRPDISIYFDGPDHRWANDLQLWINIEVERRQKKIGFPQYEFLSKLESYDHDGVETLIVVENESRAKTLASFFIGAEKNGVQDYSKNKFTNKWFSRPEGQRKKFKVNLRIGIWDQTCKKFTAAYLHNFVDFLTPEPIHWNIPEPLSQREFEQCFGLSL